MEPRPHIIRRTGHALAAAALVLALGKAGTAEASSSACDDAVFGSRVIAVSGRRLRALWGEPASSLRVWAFRDEQRLPIPFQIDECSPDGRLVVVGRAESLAEPRLGPLSVLLFRAADVGEPSPQTAALEIEVQSPEGDERRWAYVSRADGSLPLSSRDDVDYDPATDTIHAARYTLKFHAPYINYFSLANGKQQDQRNLVDRFKARVEARFLWGLISFRKNEDEVVEEVIGYKDGPIRVIRRVRLHVQIGWGVPSPDIIADDYFYADHAEAPIHISLPFSLAYVFGDLDVRVYLDFRNLDGFEVAAEGFDRGPWLVGSRERSAGATPPQRTSWFLLRRGDVTLVHRLRFGPTLSGIDCRLFYVDDANRPDPPEDDPGLKPGIGYRLTGWSSVGRGRHEIWMDTYVVDGAGSTDPSTTVARLATRFRVEVKSVTPPDLHGLAHEGSASPAVR